MLPIKRTPSKVLPFIALALVHDATAARLGIAASKAAVQQQPVEMEALLVSLAAQQQQQAASAAQQPPVATTIAAAKERAAVVKERAAASPAEASLELAYRSFLPPLPKPRFLAMANHVDGAINDTPECRYLTVSTTFTVRMTTSGTRVLDGMTVAASSAPHAITLSRADVRMCSDGPQGHARVEAECEAWELAPGGRVACSWRIELPGEAAYGSLLEHWSGIDSSVTMELSGACCHAPQLHPMTGQPGGTCRAGRG